MMRQKIRGRIIRILDTSTVVVNLGRTHGITSGSIFSILADPEPIIDPVTQEELGVVSLVKGRVRAISVSDRFTIASSKWTETYHRHLDLVGVAGLKSTIGLLAGEPQVTTETHDETLRVKPASLKPWRAISQDYVEVGDEVEVTVVVSTEQPDDTAESEEMGNEEQ